MKKRNFKAPSGETISFTELGFGTAPLGNLYRAVDPEDAQKTLEAAWKAGVRYYDTAPLYGLGLSETRLNRFLFGKKRKDYVLSTKVGRLLEVCEPKNRTGIGKFFDTPSRKERYDYSYDGVMRSIEFSLERLGLDSIDIIFMHDVDVFTHKSAEARERREDRDNLQAPQGEASAGRIAPPVASLSGGQRHSGWRKRDGSGAQRHGAAA